MSQRTGIDDKTVFYVRRYSEHEIGSYFEYRVDKEVCNPNDPYKFYLKLGGVTFLPKKSVPGKKNRTSAERIKDSKYFGSYVYYGETDRKLRCILYAKRKCIPDNKVIGLPSCLHSIIPRYDGTRSGHIVTGMKIVEVWNEGRRLWTRYDRKTKGDHPGLFELYNIDDLAEVTRGLLEQFRDEDSSDPIGFYVGANTSLMMVDVTRAHLYLDYSRDFVYTIFQEGAFICTNRPFTICFYDEENDEEYDLTRLKSEREHRLTDSKHLERLWVDREQGHIFFLKSTPNHTFWTLRVNRYRRSTNLEIQLCIPTGAQFEDVYHWNRGIKEVERRQSLEPWTKYIEWQGEHNPKFEDIDLEKNEPYPQPYLQPDLDSYE